MTLFPLANKGRRMKSNSTDEWKERLIDVDNLDDPRLQPFWNLKERTLRGESLFIAEGALVVERLLCSDYQVESILTTRSRISESIMSKTPTSTPVYCISERDVMNRIVGFDFHQGILAIGRRPARFPDVLETFERYYVYGHKGRSEDAHFASSRKRQNRCWIVLPDATKPDNLGLVFRCAAALDAEGVILGENCCDPLSRRALRVSMGGVLQVPITRATDLKAELEQVKKRFPVAYVATLLDSEASPLTSFFKDSFDGKTGFVFLFGNEYYGLNRQMIDLCDYKVIIPMRSDVDSLNLGASVGIFLYEYNRWIRS